MKPVPSIEMRGMYAKRTYVSVLRNASGDVISRAWFGSHHRRSPIISAVKQQILRVQHSSEETTRFR